MSGLTVASTDCLPQEILTHIFFYLGKDITIVLKVSQAWRKAGIPLVLQDMKDAYVRPWSILGSDSPIEVPPPYNLLANESYIVTYGKSLDLQLQELITKTRFYCSRSWINPIYQLNQMQEGPFIKRLLLRTIEGARAQIGLKKDREKEQKTYNWRYRK